MKFHDDVRATEHAENFRLESVPLAIACHMLDRASWHRRVWMFAFKNCQHFPKPIFKPHVDNLRIATAVIDSIFVQYRHAADDNECVFDADLKRCASYIGLQV